MPGIINFFQHNNTVYVTEEEEPEFPFECSIRISVMSHVFYVTSMRALYKKVRDLSRRRMWFNPNLAMMLTLHGKILQEEKSLAHYNFDLSRVNEVRVQWYALNGGGYLPCNEAIKMENTIIRNPRLDLSCMDMNVQGDEATEEDVRGARQRAEDNFAFWINYRNIQKFAASQPTDKDLAENREWFLDMIENCFIAYHSFKKADNILLWATTVYKLFTKKSVTISLLSKIESLFGDDSVDMEGQEPGVEYPWSGVQALETLEVPGIKETLKMLRTGFDTIESVDENPVLKKFYKLYCFMLTQGYLSKLGITLNEEEYSKLELRTMNVAFSSKRGMWVAAFDVILYLAEKIYEFKETGDISVFSHTDSEYAEWSKECDRIMSLGAYTGCLEAHGTTHFSYISDLNSAIEKGEAYVKYTRLRSGYESAYLRKRLASLQMVKAQQTTIKFAQKERKAPFGLLLHGPSGVGKSTFAKMLFYYFGKLRHLDTGDHFLYRRSPTDDYWTNYDTSMWCIQLDDIAFMNPNKANEIDPTLKEILNIINNVPHTPNQAALEDKGKTPIRAELVMATSNTADLNAYEYFSCPLAVQRRLPFIVTIKPKPQFAKADGMLDPTKLTMDPTRYPNYWIIEVQALKPFRDPNGRERAKIEKVHEYDDVDDFLADYGSSILQHDKNQVAAMGCDKYMSAVDVCDQCRLPKYKCGCPEVQGIEDFIPATEWIVTVQPTLYVVFYLYLLSKWVSVFFWMLSTRCVKWVYSYCMRYYASRFFAYRFLSFFIPEEQALRVLSYLNSMSCDPPKWMKSRVFVHTFATVAVTMISAYGIYSAFDTRKPAEAVLNDKDVRSSSIVKIVKEKKTVIEREDKFEEETPEKMCRTKIEVVELDPQGNKFNTTELQLEKEKTSNVWYNADVGLSRFEVPLASQSLVGKKDTDIRDMVANNICHLTSVCQIPAGKSTMQMGGVFLGSHYLLSCAHLLKEEATEWTITVSRRSRTEGISDSITLRLTPKDVVIDRVRDLCVFKVKYCPPTRYITQFWAEHPQHCGRIVEILRRATGEVDVRTVHGVELFEQMRIEKLNTSVDILLGRLSMNDSETCDGECGALSVAMTPMGPSFVGVHLLGRARVSGTNVIKKSTLEDLMAQVDALDLYPVTVQGCADPKLETADVVRKLGPLHPRSTVRYLESGALNVYGTFEGFRPQFNSKVCKTPLVKEMCAHYDYVVDHGKPVMKGWEPWKKNLEKMVLPNCSVDQAILHECAESYFLDIVNGLPPDWEKELVFLSNETAVNGLPGVKYIDGMNRKSSMGFPWNKSKKSYLIDAATEFHPNGVTFDQDFWDRVAEIEARHSANTRACPVFSGALKDTPTPFKKIDMKKTRIFTGSPADFAVVTRKKLLSFIRLLQKNKFVFEAGPGTVCQSTEWGKIKTYLVAFGEEQIVAGDFGWYDKCMVALFILVVFEIIAAIHRRAGFSKEECDAIMAIGEDTAFSWCNFDGDLIEFFGTNPSGHALTVIVNSMVNSLYMRYCFCILNPAREVRSFKQNVHLFTYGDDNVQGVSKSCPWYNHTAIQAVLATIGVEYTMADKTSESVPYIHIDNVSFLKRFWRWDADVGAYLAPIEEASIKRSLTVWLPSDTLNEYEKMIEVITSAVCEYFFYGREKFEKERSFFTQLLQQEPYCLYSKSERLPTWQELYDRFWEASSNLEATSN